MIFIAWFSIVLYSIACIVLLVANVMERKHPIQIIAGLFFQAIILVCLLQYGILLL